MPNFAPVTLDRLDVDKTTVVQEVYKNIEQIRDGRYVWRLSDSVTPLSLQPRTFIGIRRPHTGLKSHVTTIEMQNPVNAVIDGVPTYQHTNSIKTDFRVHQNATEEEAYVMLERYRKWVASAEFEEIVTQMVGFS